MSISSAVSAIRDCRTRTRVRSRARVGDALQDTYGSPCAAWSHEQATGWY